MKRILLLTLCFATAGAIQAQDCEDLFISEYCEGTGNNKGVEIYNPTSEAIDLGPYEIQRWSNGAGSSSDELNLIGSIPAYGTWVIVNGQTEDVDLGGGATSPACDPLMQAYADQLDNDYPAPTYFNGNDAILLVKNGSTVVDIFGKPGEDPGVAWTDNADAGYTAEDGGTWLTANKTLRRNANVLHGVTLPPISFFALAEYDSLSVNTWDGLGSHTCDCFSSNVEDVKPSIELNIYPNPTSDGNITIESNVKIQYIEVYNEFGKLINTTNIAATNMTQINITDQAAGRYFVNVALEGGSTFSQSVIKK